MKCKFFVCFCRGHTCKHFFARDVLRSQQRICKKQMTRIFFKSDMYWMCYIQEEAQSATGRCRCYSRLLVITYMESGVTFKIEMTSQFPFVMNVFVPWAKEVYPQIQSNVCDCVCVRVCMHVDVCVITYSFDMVDMLVAMGIALYKVKTVPICSKDWLWWWELKAEQFWY